MDCNIEVSDVRMPFGVEENVIGLYIAEGDDPSPKIDVEIRAKHTGG
jgi:hypothetical protein